MFLRMSWCCVVKVVSDISTMSTAVRIFVLSEVENMNELDSWAPNKVDCSACLATSEVIGPIAACVPSEIPLRLLSTWKSAKKKGDWKRIGLSLIHI